MPGAGIGLPCRPEFETQFEDLFAQGRLGFCELHAELAGSAWIRSFVDTLACCGVPLTLHSVRLLLLSDRWVAPVDAIRTIRDELGLSISLVSGHLASGFETRTFGECFTRPTLSNDLVARTIDNIFHLEDLLGCRVGFENVATYERPDVEDLCEIEFLNELALALPGRLVFDVSNFLSNRSNYGDSACGRVESLAHPPAYLHVSGGLWSAEVYLDTHRHPIPTAHLEATRLVAHRSGCHLILYERDGAFEKAEEVQADLAALWKIATDGASIAGE